MKYKSIAPAALLALCIAIILLSTPHSLFANQSAVDNVPTIVTYQGHLSDSNGNALEGSATLQFTIYDAAEGGTNLWSETQTNVPVTNGRFAVELGSQTPLSPAIFEGASRYLKVSVDPNNNGNFTDLPRQKLTSTPFALRAGSVDWANITNMPSGFADGTDDGGNSSSSKPDNLIIVAKNGGDYETITDALNSITPSSINPYLIWVMPGRYNERVVLKPFVHLKGSGVGKTTVVDDVFGNVNLPEAAVMVVPNDSTVSDLTVINLASTQDSSAIFVDGGNKETRLENVYTAAAVALGQRHVGVYLKSSQETLLRNVYATVNGQIGSWAVFNSASSPIIENSVLLAKGAANTNSVNGLRVNGGKPTIRHSEIRATQGQSVYGIEFSGAGNDTVTVDHSNVSGDDFGIRISTGNYRVYVGSSEVGGGANAFAGIIRCAQSYDENYQDVNNTCN